jgi:hypothetical protein
MLAHSGTFMQSGTSVPTDTVHFGTEQSVTSLSSDNDNKANININALLLCGKTSDKTSTVSQKYKTKKINYLELAGTNTSSIYTKIIHKLTFPQGARGSPNPDGLGNMLGYDDEHWIYQASKRDPQFQAINCTKCGEYKKISRAVHLPVICMCKCAI